MHFEARFSRFMPVKPECLNEGYVPGDAEDGPFFTSNHLTDTCMIEHPAYTLKKVVLD